MWFHRLHFHIPKLQHVAHEQTFHLNKYLLVMASQLFELKSGNLSSMSFGEHCFQMFNGGT